KCSFPVNFICAFEAEQLLADKGEFASLHVLKGYFLTQVDALPSTKKYPYLASPEIISKSS
ncbi:MAG TPA: hypothetical protein DHV39_02765, partial [Verrucomicrobiales bacterium]|nr:hypothetical protein [Verrucomicrobiales bacterium]